MKYIIIFFLLFIILNSCQSPVEQSLNEKYFIENEWLYGDKVFISNDTMLSNKFIDDSTSKIYPMIITDSTLQILHVDENDKTNELVQGAMVDTVPYDLKYINNKPVLLIYFDSYPILLTSKNQSLRFSETSNYKKVKFVMGGYTIGQEIDRNLLKTRGLYNYENYTIEDCELKENRDITIKIIGYNTVYSIERKNIPHFRIDEIIRVITKKLNHQPEYSPMKKWTDDSDYEYEFYRWSNYGVRMTLSKSNYIGESSFTNYFDTDEWTLSYDDDVMKAVLIEKFKNSEPKSDIIK
jgi:hypothetical protein